MFRRQDEFVRVGVRLVVVMAIVGFLVLLLYGRAYPAEFRADELTRLLLNRDPVTPAERVDAARALLRRDRQRGVARVVSAGLDTAWRAATDPSPRGMLRSGKRLYRGVRELLARSPAESRALALLEPEVEAGVDDPGLLALYEELRAREREDQLDRWCAEAERALERGDAPRVRRRIGRIRRLAPEDPRIPELDARLAERTTRAGGEALPVSRTRLELRDEDAPLAAALLAEGYERLVALEPRTSEQALARAAAMQLSGDLESASSELARLAERPERIGGTASRWLHGRVLEPEQTLRLAVRSYRLRRTLGWLGGAELEEHGLDLSRSGFRAWRESMAPLNVAVSAPTRLLRRRPADVEDLRLAARTYLARLPDGPRAAEAHAWLASTPRSAGEQRRRQVWDDGKLRLLPARTRYARVAPAPVLVTRGLIAALPDTSAEVRDALRDAPMLLLAPREVEPEAAARTLGRGAALGLLFALGRGLEEGEIEPFGARSTGARAALRRLDHTLRSGHALHAIPWNPDSGEGSLPQVLLDGEARRVRGVDLARDGEGLNLRRNLRGNAPACPGATVCLDVARELTTVAYADIDTDGDVRLGASASFHDAAVAIEVAAGGPRASLVLPIARWLGFARWVPLEASVGVHLGGISVGPRFRQPAPILAAEGPGI
jgi:hypothetical protein